MADSTSDVIVAGCGIGGMAAAVAALQGGASVTVLERAPQEERGGQTRYTEAYFRMKSEHEVTDDFESHLAENASGYLDPSLVHVTAEPRANWPAVVKSLSFNDPELISTFADAAGPTIQWLKQFGLRFDFLPTQFLTKSQPRLLPVGGGLALIEALGAAAEKMGANFVYETAATRLLQDDRRRGRRRARDRQGQSRAAIQRQGRRAGVRRFRRQRGDADALHRAAFHLSAPGVPRRLLQQGRRHPDGARHRALRRAATSAAITRNRSIRARASPSRRCSFFRTASSSIRKASASPTRRPARSMPFTKE